MKNIMREEQVKDLKILDLIKGFLNQNICFSIIFSIIKNKFILKFEGK